MLAVHQKLSTFHRDGYLTGQSYQASISVKNKTVNYGFSLFTPVWSIVKTPSFSK